MSGPTQEMSEIAKAARSDYLTEVHHNQISPEQFKNGVNTIIMFGVRFDLLDQTILQAILFFECYLAKNTNV